MIMCVVPHIYVGPLTDLTPQFVVTPLFRLNGTAVLVTEIQVCVAYYSSQGFVHATVLFLVDAHLVCRSECPVLHISDGLR